MNKILIFLLVTSSAFAIGRYALEDIVAKLDVTSFSSSIGPRKEQGKIHFIDYGFSEPEIRGNVAVIKGKDWIFRVTLLHRTLWNAIVCIEDQATNGGSYHTQAPYLLIPNKDKTVFTAQTKKIEDKGCPRFEK
jgi:hypothetical protein